MSLQDKVILVTGGSQGLGRAIVEVMATAGARVVIGDIQLEQAEKTASELQDKGHISALKLDVSDEQQAESVVNEIISQEGSIDVLINNAGVDVTKPVTELTMQEWDRVIGVNLRGPLVMAKQCLPHMYQQQRGHIINIASTAAKRAWPNATAYHASKWGLVGFSHSLFTEAREHQVKVTAVIAGGMRTPFILDRFPDVDPSTLQDPLRVAETIRFVLEQPGESIIPEVVVLPLKETSWP